MKRKLSVLLILMSASVCQGALLTNFSASYCSYQASSVLMPASRCYKLYFDPTGISEGQVHLFVDVPLVVPGQMRFDFGPENGVMATHPAYLAFTASDPSITTGGDRQRYETLVQFSSLGEPPGGEIVIFEYHVHDAMPELGLSNVHVGFEFLPGDFVTIFEPGPPPQSTTYDHTQLSDVPLQVPEPCSATLVGIFLTGLGLAHRRVLVSRRRICA